MSWLFSCCFSTSPANLQKAIYDGVDIRRFITPENINKETNSFSIRPNVTPLMIAAELKNHKAVHLLIEAKACVNQGNPLGLAIRSECDKSVEMLIEAGAHVNNNLLVTAARIKNYRAVQLLTKAGACVNQGNPLEAAIRSGCENSAIQLISAGAHFNQNLLELALEQQLPYTCKELIRKGCPLPVSALSKAKTLWEASKNSHSSAPLSDYFKRLEAREVYNLIDPPCKLHALIDVFCHSIFLNGNKDGSTFVGPHRTSPSLLNLIDAYAARPIVEEDLVLELRKGDLYIIRDYFDPKSCDHLADFKNRIDSLSNEFWQRFSWLDTEGYKKLAKIPILGEILLRQRQGNPEVFKLLLDAGAQFDIPTDLPLKAKVPLLGESSFIKGQLSSLE